MRTKRRRWVRWILALAVVTAVALLWTRPLWRGVSVQVVGPQVGAVVQTVVSSGRVMAPAELKLGAAMLGTVKAVAVDEGDGVTAGEVVVSLDDAEPRAAVARAEAALAAVQARRRALEAKLAPAAREVLRRARATLAQAERDATRSRTLADKGTLTTAEAERTETARTVARTQLRQAELDARATSHDGADVAALDASEAEARAALDGARARLDDTRVIAPADGVVLTRSVEPGEVVQPGAPLLVMARDGAQRLVIEPDEKTLRVLAVGQPAIVSADAFPDDRFAARVGWIAPAVDRRRGTIEVRLDVPTPPPRLKPDMTVSVEVEVARTAYALTLARAVIRDLAGDSPWVLVVDGDRAVRRDLTLGLRGDTVVQVTAGLDADARIVVPEARGAEPGDKVVVEATGGG